MMKRHNSMSVGLAIAFAVMNAAGVAAAANFPVGTHLVKGTLKDWQNNVLTSSAAVTIQAVATNGTVIASTPVANPSADGYNFLLQIPLSTTATDSTAAVGDSLNCVLVQESGLSLALKPLVVGEANAVSTVVLEFVNMRSYTKEGAETTVSVPAEYIESIAAWMEAYGIEGEYDPFADYDSDGASNYAEFRSGTNPFDDTDRLAITAYSAPQNALHAISFEYVGGRIYGVDTTQSLTNPEWSVQPVMKSETDVGHAQLMPSADGMKVDIFLADSADTVMIYGEIGQPPSDDDRSFGPAMLKANHLFGGTGGATLCQNPETGEYAIFQAFPLSGLNAESLAEHVARIVDKTEHWRNILNAFQVAEREKGADAAEEVLLDAIHGGTGGFIQV